MPDSKQLAILKDITTILEGITAGNGYAHDLDGKVFRGRMKFGHDVAPPYIAILEAPKTAESLEVGDEALKREETWTLLIHGFVTDDKLNPLDPAYALKADVEHRLSRIVQEAGGGGRFPTHYRLGGKIHGLAIGPGICRPPDEVSAQAYFFLPVAVRMVTDASAPYMS